MKFLFKLQIFLLFIMMGLPGGLFSGSPGGKKSFAYFDFWVYGEGLNEGKYQIFLKTNLFYGNKWECVGKFPQHSDNLKVSKEGKLLIISRLKREKYWGQDIRENYVAVKMVSPKGNPTVSVKGMYIFSSQTEEKEGLERKIRRIENQYPVLNKKSLAYHVRPRAYTLVHGVPYIEHVEAPVKGHKPGVLEVEWLEMIFKHKRSQS